MSTSKEYKAVRNCILNELHLTKEDIIKNIEPLLEKLVKRCMHNTYGGNNQIENWIRCMVNDELKQKEGYGFVRKICGEVIKDHVLNELNIIVRPKNERCVCENRVPDNIMQIYNVLSFHKPQTQIIAIVHNPALIYKLSKLDCVNFIEMTEGYLNKTCTFVSN